MKVSFCPGETDRNPPYIKDDIIIIIDIIIASIKNMMGAGFWRAANYATINVVWSDNNCE